MQKRGRKMKLTEEVLDQFVTALRGSMYLETAAAYIGVSKQSVYDWLRRGARARAMIKRCPGYKLNPKERLCVKFLDAVKKTMALVEMGALAHIQMAASEQWTAAAWMLERRFPGRWSRRERVEHTGRDGGPIRMVDESALRAMNDAELSKYGRELAAALAERARSIAAVGTVRGGAPSETERN